MFAWIFFRAQNLDEAILIIQKIYGAIFVLAFDISEIKLMVLKAGFSFNVTKNLFYALIISIGIAIVLEFLQEKNKALKLFCRVPRIFRWTLYYATIAFIILFGYFGEVSFIYFQF